MLPKSCALEVTGFGLWKMVINFKTVRALLGCWNVEVHHLRHLLSTSSEQKLFNLSEFTQVQVHSGGLCGFQMPW